MKGSFHPRLSICEKGISAVNTQVEFFQKGGTQSRHNWVFKKSSQVKKKVMFVGLVSQTSLMATQNCQLKI